MDSTAGATGTMMHLTPLHTQANATKSRFCAILPLLILGLSAALLLAALAVPTRSQAQTISQPLQAAADSAPPAFRPGRLLVGIEPDTPLDSFAAILAAQGLTLRRVYPALHIAEVSLPDIAPSAPQAQALGPDAADATQAAQAALMGLPGVRYVMLDYRVQLAQADGPGGSPTVPVAIIDTGYDITHPDLPQERLWVNAAEQNGRPGVDDDDNGYVDDIYGWDWVGAGDGIGDNEPQDEQGHGTHVFGIVAAAVDNGIGIAGLGPNLRAAPLRVLDATGAGWVSDVIAALDYARAMGFRVANLSLTVGSDMPAFGDAIRAAYDAGMLVVAATGNTRSTVLWPAAYPEVLAVAATTETDFKAEFSNTGEAVDLAAPGNEILSTYLGGDYRLLSGTSMAAPHAAAGAALLWSLRPDLNVGQIVDLLKSTAVDVNRASLPGPDSELGAGRIDLAAALLKATTIPGPPAEIVRIGDGVPPITAADNEWELTFLVQDKNGNLVADGTAVQFFSADGTLNPAADETGNGQVETALIVRDPTQASAHVRVLTPSTALEVTFEIPLARRYFLPAIRVPEN
ncbi:MAG: hypothetical protein DCC57_03905 [Chloroflexi bacterium]|nr:MAG: hypothetical protein DCC57_03905 [Chloroflexota bacterium]